MEENGPIIHVLDRKVALRQPAEGFRTSLDSVFLAAACPAADGERVLDMGCGVGGAAFCVLARVPGAHLTGVDIEPDFIAMAKENITLNGREGRADFFLSDIRDFQPSARFDHVICNPPYLESGAYTVSPKAQKAVALGHTDKDIALRDWIDAGFRHVKPAGSLTVIHRADMIDRILQEAGGKFGAAEIFPLWPRAGEAAKRVIVRLLKERKSPAIIHAGLILHGPDGRYTDDAESVLRGMRPIMDHRHTADRRKENAERKRK